MASIAPQYQPAPNGPIDSQSGTISPDGQSAIINLPDLSPLENWLNQGGYTTGVNSGTPTVLPNPTPAPGTLLNPGDPGYDPNANPSNTPMQTGIGDLAAKAGSGVLSLFGLTGDSVVAVILGVVFIVGGLFLLSKGPAVNIVTSQAKKLAVGA